MATYTSFLNLEKPTTSERLDVLKINSNWDKIDEGVSSLNSKLTPTKITLTAMEGVTIDNQDCYTVGKILYVAMRFTINTARDAYANLFQLPNAYFASDVTIPVFTQYNGLVTSNPSSIYADKGSSMLRNPGYTMSTGTYKITATLLIQ